MDETLKKSLTDLIDETLLELEELKKSRYSAAEVEMKGPGDGIGGKPSNGDLHAKAEDEHEEDEDEEKAKKAEESDDEEDEDEEAEKADCEKSEGTNEEAAKGEGTNEEASKGEDDPADSPETKRKLKELLGKKEEPHKDDPKHEEKEKKMAQKLLDMHKYEMKKSIEESESLLKSAIEERVRPLEDKLSTIFDLVKQIAEQPVPSKGATARAIPLMKSSEEERTETLSKSEVASRLFELKKSGTKVDSADIARAEMGHDLNKIVEKYKIS
jgi:hypothetical protein